MFFLEETRDTSMIWGLSLAVFGKGLIPLYSSKEERVGWSLEGRDLIGGTRLVRFCFIFKFKNSQIIRHTYHQWRLFGRLRTLSRKSYRGLQGKSSHLGFQLPFYLGGCRIVRNSSCFEGSHGSCCLWIGHSLRRKLRVNPSYVRQLSEIA